MKIINVLSLLLLTSCATNYYWASNEATYKCLPEAESKNPYSHMDKCSEVEKTKDYVVFQCKETQTREYKRLVSSNRNMCNKAIKDKFNVSEYIHYKGTKFKSSEYKKAKSNHHVNYWTHTYLRKLKENEVKEHIGIELSPELASKNYYKQEPIPSKSSYPPGTKLKLQKFLTSNLVEVTIKGKTAYIVGNIYKRVDELYTKNPKFIWKKSQRKKEEQSILKGQYFEGMSKEAFRAIFWNKRFKVNQYNSGREEQWILNNQNYFYFRNNILHNWQKIR